jgi:hypothetical protein
MDKTAFQALARDLRRQLQLQDDPGADAVNLVVEGVPFTLSCGPEWGEDRLLFLSDFGPVPAGDRARMLERVLETNLYMFGPDAPTFSINPGTGHLVLMGLLPLQGLTAQALLDALPCYTLSAHQWRANGFMEAPEPEALTPA